MRKQHPSPALYRSFMRSTRTVCCTALTWDSVNRCTELRSEFLRLWMSTSTKPTCSVEVHIQSLDRKSTRLNSSHDQISYAVFCLKKKKKKHNMYNMIII